jgi:hypothetical protein
MAAQTITSPESLAAPTHIWQYLEARPHPWRRQLSVKGLRLLASSVWSDMVANQFTVEEIAHSRSLPVEAVQECVQYCEENRSLLDSECEQEKRWLLARGVSFESPSAG